MVGKMEKFVLWFLFLAGSLAQEDLVGNVFLFPKPSVTTYAILKPKVEKPLKTLTVCLRSYTSLTRFHPLFSLATRSPDQDNAFLIFPKPPNQFSIYINQEENVFKVDPSATEWKHTCVSWDSASGVIELWIDGKLYPRTVSKKASSIGSPSSIILGQEQDYFGGGFNVDQSFVGEISDVHMWDYVLTPDHIQKVLFANMDFTGNILSWRSLQYELRGQASSQPKRQCKALEHHYGLFAKCYE
ncbi:hypothetical protein XENTR_v10022299 [Xenopus tropicalis]|uniref:Pentraxin family member n=2 Tax=Xenopus tropicalis TaxID=8364 RepID=F6Y907_XENTR|eukprot:XP_012809480.1 PREDICTED: C-reactive protein, pentraxin-related, gene 4 isoform X1 [Xenopus tropicalis]